MGVSFLGDYDVERIKGKSLDMALFRRLTCYLRPYKYYLAAALFLLMLAKAIEAIIPIFIGEVTNWVLDPMDVDPESTYHSVMLAGAGIIGILVFGYLLEAVNVVLRSWVGRHALLSLRQDVYDHILKLPIRYYDHHTIGSLMTRTIHDVDQINQMFSESIVSILGNLFLFVGIFVGIIWIDWRIAIAIGCLVPLVVWHTNIFRISQGRSFKWVRAIVATMNGFIQEQLMGISLVKKFGLVDKELRTFSIMNKDLKTAFLQTIYNFAFFIAGIDFATTAFLVVVFVILVTFSPDGGFQAGTYFTLSLYSLMIFRPLSDIAERFNVLQSAFAASERVFRILDTPKEEMEEGSDDLDEIESIVFDEVWFAYKEEEWVLRGLSFEVKRGDSVAFVGVTGAGKTTIISLLLRFYDYQKGNILINGKPINYYSKQALRRHFSTVLQDPVILSGTVKENITFQDPSITDEQVDQAIEYVNMKEYVDRWPGGLLHKLTERGKSLSVGEMQLISMARSVAHNRSVVILDEATANIDSHTEMVIRQALEKILHDKTAMIIAHRLSTIKHVDTIFVIHDGVVAEKGAHSELLNKNGIYEKLYHLQTI
jgi:ATP-binding cassette, subfamily B, multidrug efflux pump